MVVISTTCAEFIDGKDLTAILQWIEVLETRDQQQKNKIDLLEKQNELQENEILALKEREEKMANLIS